VRLLTRTPALDRGDLERYRDLTENLLASLKGLLGRGRVGEMFSEQTTTAMRRDVPVVFDVSSIPDTQLALQGAALMACWSAGFGAVNVAHALADAGLEPERHYWIVLDEVWRSLRAGLVDNMDGVTRLNRNEGVGQAMITHTMSDLEALAREEDRMKARGFVERAGMVLCGALPRAEFSKLRQVMAFSDAEQEMVVGWTNPPAWDAAGPQDLPRGCGNFLAKSADGRGSRFASCSHPPSWHSMTPTSAGTPTAPSTTSTDKQRERDLQTRRHCCYPYAHFKLTDAVAPRFGKHDVPGSRLGDLPNTI